MLKKDPTSIALEQALSRLQRLCSRGEKCTDDMRKKLQEWNIPLEVAEKIVRQLQTDHFLDDLRYARAFVHDKFELSGWGVLKIRNALYLKKIDNNIIQEALSGIDNMAARRKLERLLHQKNKSLKATSPADRKLKLLRFAIGRGYDYQAVYEAVEEIVNR